MPYSIDKHSFLTIILVMLLSSAGFYLGVKLIRQLTISDAQKIQQVWTTDLGNLKGKPEIAEILTKIQAVSIEPAQSDDLAKRWIENLELPIKASPDGIYFVDILVISDAVENQSAATVQMTFIDSRSGDVIAEIARRYEL